MISDQAGLRPQAKVLEEASAWFFTMRERPDDAALVDEFKRWIAADPAHAVAADTIAATWRGAADLAARPSIVGLRARMADEARRPALSGTWRALAASFVLLSLAAIAGLVLLDGKKLQETYATARGERLDVALADGSKLHLNGDTRVEIAYGWFERRLELVRGEAEFQVAKDNLRPFTVEAGRFAVRAVGTDFAVRRDADLTSVVLVEGIVTLQPVATSFVPVTLQPGSKAVLAGAGVRPSVSQVNVKGELAWRDGLIVFHRTTLADALREFGRYTGTSVQLQSPDLARLEVSGTYRATELQSFLDGMAQLHGLRWSRVEDTYRVARR